MLSPLTKEQWMKVEENMGLVGKVIQDCVHTLGAGSMFDYDDLFQIGCLGLCKAAQTDKPGHTVAFSTYAYRLIRNEIYTELERATRRGREVATDPAELPCTVLDDDTPEQREACSLGAPGAPGAGGGRGRRRDGQGVPGHPDADGRVHQPGDRGDVRRAGKPCDGVGVQGPQGPRCFRVMGR